MKNINIKKWIILITALLFLSGCASRLTTDVRVNKDGKILMEEKIDQPTIERIENIEKRTYLAYQGFTKKDWGLFVNYELRLSISSLSALNQDATKLSFSFLLPGELLETNADEVKGNELIWESFKEDEIFARSREIRWWLIVSLGAAVLLYLFYRYTKRK